MRIAWCCQVRMQVFEMGSGSGLGFSCTTEKYRAHSVETGMMQQETRKLAARVAADAGDGNLRRCD